jgi:hypothetical protein
MPGTCRFLGGHCLRAAHFGHRYYVGREAQGFRSRSFISTFAFFSSEGRVHVSDDPVLHFAGSILTEQIQLPCFFNV